MINLIQPEIMLIPFAIILTYFSVMYIAKSSNEAVFEPQGVPDHIISTKEVLLVKIINDYRLQFGKEPLLYELANQKFAIDKNTVNLLRPYEGYNDALLKGSHLEEVKSFRKIIKNPSQPIDIFRKLLNDKSIEPYIVSDFKYIGYAVLDDSDHNRKYITIVFSY